MTLSHWQGAAATLLTILLLAPHSAGAQATQPGDQMLRNQCDALIDSAVKRRYGWAWMEQGDPDPRRRAIERVSFHPQLTPANGLVLYLAGRRLGEPRYIKAAVEVADAIMAVQDRQGRISMEASFGRTPAARLRREKVQDRSATTASLGLLLTLAADPELRTDRLRRSAERAANWLMRQQTQEGSWPVEHPPGLDPLAAERLIRLATPEYRDGTLALLLAQDVLEDLDLRKAAGRALDMLLRLRINEPGRSGRWLWSTYYATNGTPRREMADWPYGADALAGRHSIQTLLIGYDVLNQLEHRKAIKQAVASLKELKNPAGFWQRVTPLQGRWVQPATQPATTLPLFAARGPAHERTATFGLDMVLPQAEQLFRAPPPPTTRPTIDQHLRHRIAAILCGLESQAGEEFDGELIRSEPPALGVWELLGG